MVAATAPFMLVFRFLHIVAGVLWVGSTFLFFGFIGPSADEVGPSAQPVLTAAVKKRKAVKVITGLALVNVVAGWVLWLKNMSLYGSLGHWVTSRFGLVLTIGGVLQTIAAVLGLMTVAPGLERLIDAGNLVAKSGDARPRLSSRRGLISSGMASRRMGRSISCCCSSRSLRWRLPATAK